MKVPQVPDRGHKRRREKGGQSPTTMSATPEEVAGEEGEVKNSRPRSTASQEVAANQSLPVCVHLPRATCTFSAGGSILYNAELARTYGTKGRTSYTLPAKVVVYQVRPGGGEGEACASEENVFASPRALKPPGYMHSRTRHKWLQRGGARKLGKEFNTNPREGET